jgi:glycosyltransferase involved in cell wall biosynthesis
MSKRVPDPGYELIDGKRLLFVVNAAWFFISHRLPLAEAALFAGYEVHIAAGTATTSEIQMLKGKGFRFHQLNLQRSSGNPLHNALLFLQLIKIYRAVRPDLVHHVTIKPVILGTLVARILRVRAVVNAVSGLGYSFSSVGASRRLLRYFVGLAYRVCLTHDRMTIIFQNPDDRRDFLKWTNLKFANDVLIPGSGVDLNRFFPGPEPEGIIRVVLPARMLRDKGIVEFATAIGQLRVKGISVEGVMAGSTDVGNPECLKESELHDLEARYGVRWVGHCGDMAKLFSESNVVCLPSYREGLPKALIEAAAAGRAIVTTDVPGCRHVVEDAVTGLLVPPRNVALLASALERLILDSNLRRQLGAAARLRAAAEFGIEKITSKTLEVYAKAR